MYLKPTFENKSFTEPFWAVRRLEKTEDTDKSHANMQFVYLTITGTYTANGPIPNAVAGHTMSTVLAMTNRREVAAEEELTFQDEVSRKRPPSLKPIKEEQVTKKGKTTESSEF